MAFARVRIGAARIDACTEQQVVDAVRAALDRGAGGRVITPNVDILRQAAADDAVRGYLADATLVVADGMPLVWASRLAGTPLPERVAGSALVWALARGLARDGRSVYLLGGEPRRGPVAGQRAAQVDPRPPTPGERGPVGERARVADQRRPMAVADQRRPIGDERGAARGNSARGSQTSSGDDQRDALTAGDGATRAAQLLCAASPGLRLAGAHSPGYGFERDPATFARVCRHVVATRPDLVYVGLGFPKQEWVISQLRADLPATWFVGCGMAINYVAGERVRAPRWMQRAGLEWAHRLAAEPRRLAGRYVRHDAPYALRLLATAWAARYRP